MIRMSKQIDEFIDKYTPEIAANLRTCRRKLRVLVPRGFELVYDNYNALVFGFAPSEKASTAPLSIAGYPKWVTLFFLQGASLVDPQSLLEGTGSQVRSIRLDSPDDLDKPSVEALVMQALEPCSAEFASAPKLKTIIKSISEKQRPRRPTEAKPRRAAAKKRTKRRDPDDY